MLDEPATKRTIAFVDGQNLFHAAKESFGYAYPNYDVLALAGQICQRQEWKLQAVRFYTGVPDRQDNPFWHHFWVAKLGAMGHGGVHVYSRSLRYRNQTVRLSDGRKQSFLVAEEKGIDVRIALDVIHFAERDEYDVALIFSQDQDLFEVVDDVRSIARRQYRWIKLASAFPSSPTSRNRRGINNTDWIRMDRDLYDSCLDSQDYRRTSS